MESNKVLISAAVTLLALTGCQTMREHPRMTAFVAGSLVLTAGGAFRHSHDEPSHDPAICGVNRESCR